jgi:hypothetical protein
VKISKKLIRFERGNFLSGKLTNSKLSKKLMDPDPKCNKNLGYQILNIT